MIPEDSRLHVDDGDHSEDNCMRAYARRTTSSSIIVICIHIYILNAGMYFVCGAWYGHIVRDFPQWGGFCPEPRPLEWSGLPCAPMYGGGPALSPGRRSGQALCPNGRGGLPCGRVGRAVGPLPTFCPPCLPLAPVLMPPPLRTLPNLYCTEPNCADPKKK